MPPQGFDFRSWPGEFALDSEGLRFALEFDKPGSRIPSRCPGLSTGKMGQLAWDVPSTVAVLEKDDCEGRERRWSEDPLVLTEASWPTHGNCYYLRLSGNSRFAEPPLESPLGWDQAYVSDKRLCAIASRHQRRGSRKNPSQAHA